MNFLEYIEKKNEDNQNNEQKQIISLKKEKKTLFINKEYESQVEKDEIVSPIDYIFS